MGWENKESEEFMDEALKDKSVGWKKIDLTKYPLVALQGISEVGFIQTRFAAQSNNVDQNKNSVTNQYSFSLDASCCSSS